MGYRLAGIDVVAAVEIDARMADCYEANLGEGKVVRLPVGEVAQWDADRLAQRFGVVDILDGSPPCSVFSLSGDRQKKWGAEFHFAEGQAKQRLDLLFFDFIALAKALRPRVVVGENVVGLLNGKARGFVVEIVAAFSDAGYDTQAFVLDAAAMGVPQRRRRVFFIARRRDLDMASIALDFDEPPIASQDALSGCVCLPDEKLHWLTPRFQDLWSRTRLGGNFGDGYIGSRKGSYIGRRSCFNIFRLDSAKPANTVTTTHIAHWSEPRFLHSREICRLQTFPDDYAFGALRAQYGAGMSVPPQMSRRLGLALADWLDAAPQT